MTDNKNSMYIKACVIANGIQDAQNDVITKEDIKKIFTNNLDVGYDVDHDNVRQDGIYCLENYISKSEEKLGKHVVPSGSWMTVLRIDNESIKKAIKEKEIKGVSINAYPEKGTRIEKDSPRKYLLYRDVIEKEKIHPREISLVKHPSNKLPLEIMDYDMYISKSIKGENIMSEQEVIEKTDDNLSIIKELTGIVNRLLVKKDEEKTDEKEELVEETEEKKEAEDNRESVEENDESEEALEDLEEEKEENDTKEADDEETTETESVSKGMMPPQQNGNTMPNQQQQPMGDANQILIQIAKLCTQYFNGQQQPQQPQQPQQGIQQSEDKQENENQIQKQITKKETEKLEATEIPPVNHGDSMINFAKQQGRDPWTFEKL